MSIVDSHFHVWRQADLPWLSGPMQPRIFGSYAPIRRDYPISEYLADQAGSGVDRAVYVQANWAPERGYDEAAWVQSLADKTGWPHGIVAFADMTADEVRPALDRLAALPLLRGIRQQFHWHESPMLSFAERPDLCTDPAVQRNIAALADYGLTFDLQVFAEQMEGAAALAEACPQVTFVLQHAGMLEDRSEKGRAAWRAGMARLAACPNVMCKLSGFGTFLHSLDRGHIAWLTAEAVALFGATRCMWGSNFPIESLWTDYRPLLAAHRDATAEMSGAERNAIFYGTASRVYRLDD